MMGKAASGLCVEMGREMDRIMRAGLVLLEEEARGDVGARVGNVGMARLEDMEDRGLVAEMPDKWRWVVFMDMVCELEECVRLGLVAEDMVVDVGGRMTWAATKLGWCSRDREGMARLWQDLGGGVEGVSAEEVEEDRQWWTVTLVYRDGTSRLVGRRRGRDAAEDLASMWWGSKEEALRCIDVRREEGTVDDET